MGNEVLYMPQQDPCVPSQISVNLRLHPDKWPACPNTTAQRPHNQQLLQPQSELTGKLVVKLLFAPFGDCSKSSIFDSVHLVIGRPQVVNANDRTMLGMIRC
jgi:hypothetical protein